jgi:hypothetical protein
MATVEVGTEEAGAAEAEGEGEGVHVGGASEDPL